MSIDDPFDLALIAFFLVVIGFLAYTTIKHGGFKGAMFGAKIRQFHGEVSSSSVMLMTVLVRVHSLDGGSPAKAVGLELVAKSIGSQSLTPIVLSKESARKLAALLETAAGKMP